MWGWPYENSTATFKGRIIFFNESISFSIKLSLAIKSTFYWPNPPKKNDKFTMAYTHTVKCFCFRVTRRITEKWRSRTKVLGVVPISVWQWINRVAMSEQSCTDSSFIEVYRIPFAYQWYRGEEGLMCLTHSCEVHVWKKYYLPSASGSPPHICLMAMWLIILGIPAQDAPRRQDSYKGLCFPQHPPVQALVLLWLSYREGLGPSLELISLSTKDHLRLES